ncbi:mucin-associated surface protein [Trypanosoma cruzi cruzi]|uniref:Mucin-associated surface protein (MASP) n=1 Tax=Trypanosoma cruzi TaxID=5693 RepID=A0A2V2UL62_TRYCR|nr:mucin-associated surface protein [Trypanosoma cruzi cruzi]PWU84879.1 Mucin-associated surface protein (MASP) [Trypanosoma cruzi]
MAMMMTGRVLLVCALCVLWCGACGGFANEEKAGRVSGTELLPESKGPETSPQGSKGSQNRAPGGKENITPVPGEEADDDDDDDEDEDDERKTEEENAEGQSVQEGKVALGSDSREENLIGSENETGQAIVSAGGISPSGSQKSNANPTQPEAEEKREPDKNPPVENTLTPVNGENTLLEGIAGGNPSPPPEDGVDSRKQDGEDATSEDKKKFPSPETAATTQSHREEGSEGTGEDRKATTATANTTDTTSTQNSDGSTAASHTTSPLLLLFLVACAAAAAVVAA